MRRRFLAFFKYVFYLKTTVFGSEKKQGPAGSSPELAGSRMPLAGSTVTPATWAVPGPSARVPATPARQPCSGVRRARPSPGPGELLSLPWHVLLPLVTPAQPRGHLTLKVLFRKPGLGLPSQPALRAGASRASVSWCCGLPRGPDPAHRLPRPWPGPWAGPTGGRGAHMVTWCWCFNLHALTEAFPEKKRRREEGLAWGSRPVSAGALGGGGGSG